MGTNLVDWYKYLNEKKEAVPLTPETIMIPADATDIEINNIINYFKKKPEKFGIGSMPDIPPQSGAFFRVNEVSPKIFKPYKTAVDVRIGLRIQRVRAYPGSILCFRQYIPDIGKSYVELRCFISGGRCTAITQNDSQRDSEPIENPEAIKNLAVAFADLCIKRLKNVLSDYTLDIAINLTTYWMFVVEINSSHREDAGLGLFDEDNPADLAQLDRGEKIIFRYYTSIFFEIGEI